MHRQRPLQNSMFLPQNNSRRQSTEYNPHFNTLKKSSTFNGSGDMHQHQYFVSPNHITNIGNTPRPQQRQQSRQNPQLRIIQIAINELNEKMEKLNRLVEKHQNKLTNNETINGKAQQITKTVMNQIRQSLPFISTNNDVYEHIFNIKMEIKDLRDQLTKNNKENEFKKLQINIKQIMNEQNKKIFENKTNQSSNVNNELLRKRDQYFQNLIGNLQTQLVFLKKHLNNHSLDMKVSPISSSSTIILKYQEMFKARTRGQTDMIISQHTYYIDNQGFLLDNQSRYLVDQKGKKVKLEQKHINMLKSQKILQ